MRPNAFSTKMIAHASAYSIFKTDLLKWYIHFFSETIMPQAQDPTIATVFPSGVLKHERWGIMVNGLDEDAIPQGKRLGSAVSVQDKNRVFHMLDCNEERVKLGVFQSLPGEDAPCYALILERAPLGSRQANDMADTYNEKLKSGQFIALPSDVLPTIGNANRFIEELAAHNVQPAFTM